MSRTAGQVPGQILVLGLLFATIAVVSDTVWVLVAGAFRAWFARSPRRLELVGGFGGLSIAAVGASFWRQAAGTEDTGADNFLVL